MGIALVIAGGLVLMTVFAAGFDYLTKRRNRVDNETKAKVEELAKRVESLEQTVQEKDRRIDQLESDFAFVNRLLDKK